MQITDEIINDSVAQKPFGSFEPFISGGDRDAWQFYSGVLSALGQVPGVSVIRETDHQGSGYASYVSAFLYPSDGSTRRDYPTYIQTIGILLYMSRLAPIAVYGASGRTENNDGRGSSSGFIGANNVGTLPDGDWTVFLAAVRQCLDRFRIEMLPREPLLQPAPAGIEIPTVFDGPYYVFDTLFYWSD
jgi:hypothetical protein